MTEERLQKIEKVLSERQYGLGVVLENVEDPHNIAAIMRTCDAAGVQDLYVIDAKDKLEGKIGWKSSRSATKWITVHRFNNTEDCMQVVRNRFDRILATTLNEKAVSVYDTDLSTSVALLFGNEKKGLTEKIIGYADGSIIIPQHGMLQSLNISVACAVTIFEAVRQRTVKGMFDNRSLPDKLFEQLHKDWSSKRKSIGK